MCPSHLQHSARKHNMSKPSKNPILKLPRFASTEERPHQLRRPHDPQEIHITDEAEGPRNKSRTLFRQLEVTADHLRVYREEGRRQRNTTSQNRISFLTRATVLLRLCGISAFCVVRHTGESLRTTDPSKLGASDADAQTRRTKGNRRGKHRRRKFPSKPAKEIRSSP